MTRDEVLNVYEVHHGVIVSPGKFENEPVYAPALYEWLLGGVTEDIWWGDYTVTNLVDIDDYDRAEWPELDNDTVAVHMGVTERGFFWCEELTQPELNALLERHKTAWGAEEAE